MELDTFFLKKDFREWSHAQKTQEVSEDPGVSRSVQLCIFMHFSGQLDSLVNAREGKQCRGL